MATREARRTSHEDDEDTRDQWTEPEDADGRDSDDDISSPNRQLVRTPARRSPAHRVVSGEVFNPRRAIPVGLLRLARNWSDAGSIYQAIHAYTEVLIRYPQTGAAEAAVEELLVLAEKLVQQGRYYAALNIFNKLEELC